MSLYSIMFGKSANSEQLLQLLGLTENDFYRFRDCYLDESGLIAVYTRGGGGNHRCYASEYNGMECQRGEHAKECVVTLQSNNRKHPLYVEDEDDDFDSTYCTFYFKMPEIPEELKEGLQSETNRNEAWLLLIDKLKEKSEGGKSE